MPTHFAPLKGMYNTSSALLSLCPHNLLLNLSLPHRQRSWRQHPLNTNVPQKLPSHPLGIQHLGGPGKLPPYIQSTLFIHGTSDIMRNLKRVFNGDQIPGFDGLGV